MLQELIVELTRTDKNVHFLMIGDGPLLAQLKIFIRAHRVPESAVTFTGIIAQEKAPDYLMRCDAFLCPTRSSADGVRFFGSPTKLFEYMSMARLIIASDIEQLSEVLYPAFKVSGVTEVVPLKVHNQVGLVVDPSDIQGFINACKLCLAMSHEDQSRMGNNARQKVLAHYTWKQHVQKIIEHAGL